MKCIQNVEKKITKSTQIINNIPYNTPHHVLVFCLEYYYRNIVVHTALISLSLTKQYLPPYYSSGVRYKKAKK